MLSRSLPDIAARIASIVVYDEFSVFSMLLAQIHFISTPENSIYAVLFPKKNDDYYVCTSL